MQPLKRTSTHPSIMAPMRSYSPLATAASGVICVTVMLLNRARRTPEQCRTRLSQVPPFLLIVMAPSIAMSTVGLMIAVVIARLVVG